MRRFSTRFKARVRIVDMWVDVGARSGESGEVARPHCPVRRVHGRPILGTATARERLYGSFLRLDTRATRGPARWVRGGARAACHPPASLGVASALRAIPLAPAAVDRARAPRERPDLVQICPSRPPRETVFFLCGAAIVAAVINPAPNLSLTFPLPPRPPSFRSSTARSSCLSRACWSSRRR